METQASTEQRASTRSQDATTEYFGLISRRIELSTGVELHYVESGDPGGDVLILLHGYSDSWRTWERNLPLIDPAFHVYALSLRGHGDSAKPDSGYTQADFIGDIVAFMDTLGIEQATLIGHSGGSFNAHGVASAHPERVRRLVLIGSAPTMATNGPMNEIYTDVVRLTDPVDPVFVGEFQSGTAVRPIPPDFLDIMIAESLKVPATAWKQTLAGFLAEDHSAQLRKVTAKTLIIWGDRDAIFSLEEQRALLALIPQSTFLTFAGTGHAVHWEQPERFVAELHAFLAQPAASRAPE